MEGKMADDIPCSSLVVDCAIRVGAAGSIWGLCVGPYEARKRGLSGIPRASFVVNSIGRYGLQCGFFAAVYSITQCRVKRYRKQDDWVNASIAGGIAGALIAVRTRSWKQVFGMAALLSTFSPAVDFYKRQSNKPFDESPHGGAR